MPNVDQVLDLHAEALTLGGTDGLRSVHLLHSAIGQVGQTVFGQDGRWARWEGECRPGT